MKPRRTFLVPAQAGAPRRVAYSEGQRTRPADATSSLDAARMVDLMIVGLMALAITLMLCISSSILTNWKIHYVTPDGNPLEKLHPATYLVFLALFLQLFRNGNPVAGLFRIFADTPLVFVYVMCWLALLVQVVLLARPFTVVVDTFLLPPVICVVIWRLSPDQKRTLAWVFHAGVLLNVVLGYYEYFSGHRLVPLTLGNVVVFGEWRSAALLGLPLTAAGLIAAYVMTLILRPAVLPPYLRTPLVMVCFASLMVFGGRTALIATLAVTGIIVIAESFRFLNGKRTSVPNIILAFCLISAVAAAIILALSTGVFDKMLLRFSSDKGSTLARFATFQLLSHLDWSELILGTDATRVTALQSQLGLNYGIENFWVSSIVQFGLIHTILMTAGLACLFTELVRRSHPGIWAVILLIIMIAASSVSFSSKNIQMAQFIVLITLLLPKESLKKQAAVPRPSQHLTHSPPLQPLAPAR